MVCTKCGLDIDTGAVFCGNCGQPVQNPSAATPVPAAQASTMAMAGTVPTAQAPMEPVASAAPVMPVAAPEAFPAAAQPVAQPVPAPIDPATVASAPGVPAYGLPDEAVQPGGGKAIAAMVFGILGLLTWLVPVIGLLFGSLATYLARKSRKSSHPSMATAGLVMGIIATVLSAIIFIFNMVTMDKGAAAISALLR